MMLEEHFNKIIQEVNSMTFPRGLIKSSGAIELTLALHVIKLLEGGSN